MKPQAILAPAVVALGVATSSLLAPQAASALDFTFSFGGVKGLIEGLQDNASNQTSPLVKVTDSPIGGLGSYTNISPIGFAVSAGAISAADYLGFTSRVPTLSDLPRLEIFDCILEDPTNGARLETVCGQLAVGGNLNGVRTLVFESGTVSFDRVVPAESVPGPIPLLGAAAAFGISRRLRRRIKGSSNRVPTAPFA